MPDEKSVKKGDEQGIAGTEEVWGNVNKMYPSETPIAKIIEDTTVTVKPELESKPEEG